MHFSHYYWLYGIHRVAIGMRITYCNHGNELEKSGNLFKFALYKGVR